MWREERNKKGTFVDQGSRLSSLGRSCSQGVQARMVVKGTWCGNSAALPQGPCADTTHRGAPTDRWSDGERDGDTYDDTGLCF